MYLRFLKEVLPVRVSGPYFRIPVFMKQWDEFLEECRVQLCDLSPQQRRDIATYLVPEVWIFNENTLCVFTGHKVDIYADKFCFT